MVLHRFDPVYSAVLIVSFVWLYFNSRILYNTVQSTGQSKNITDIASLLCHGNQKVWRKYTTHVHEANNNVHIDINKNPD